MKKKTALPCFLTLCILFFAAAGCTKPEDTPATNPAAQQPPAAEEVPETEYTKLPDDAEKPTEGKEEDAPKQTESERAVPGFSYADLAGYEFQFCSGIDAWGTSLSVQEDGTFRGEYHDSDMGDIGDGYPGGTLYLSRFTGTFSEPEKINDYTYAATLTSFQTEQTNGEEEISDGVLHIYSDAFGIYDAKQILIYLPGAPLAELPKPFLEWVHYNDLSAADETTLPFYGLYNVAGACGFSSYKTDRQPTVTAEIAAVQSQADELEAKLTTAQTQLEMNETAAAIYRLWDDALNLLWNRLEETLDPTEMSVLAEEERTWISEKETQIAAAGAEYTGATMQPLAEAQKGAQLTRERVYELAEYLK